MMGFCVLPLFFSNFVCLERWSSEQQAHFQRGALSYNENDRNYGNSSTKSEGGRKEDKRRLSIKFKVPLHRKVSVSLIISRRELTFISYCSSKKYFADSRCPSWQTKKKPNLGNVITSSECLHLGRQLCIAS